MANITKYGESPDLSKTETLYLINNRSGIELSGENVGSFKSACDGGLLDSKDFVVLEKDTDGTFKYSNFICGMPSFNSVILVDSNGRILGFCTGNWIEPKYDITVSKSGGGVTEDIKEPNPWEQCLEVKIHNYFGNEPYNFVNDLELVFSAPRVKFTSSILDSEKNLKSIDLGGSYVESGELYKNCLRSTFLINPKGLSVDKIEFGYVMGDLSVYIQSGDLLNVVSLEKFNKFGNPISYTKDFIKVDGLSGKDWYPNGNYIVSESGSLYFSGDEPSEINYPKSPGFVDSLGRREMMYADPSHCLGSPVNNNVSRKIGKWYLDTGGTLHGPLGNLKTASGEKFYIVNDNTILLDCDGYYVLYKFRGKSYSTEKARGNGSMSTVSIAGTSIQFAVTGEGNDQLYLDYYKQGEIQIIGKSELFKNTELWKYRKFPESVKFEKVPKIVGACEGLLFYLSEDNKLLGIC